MTKEEGKIWKEGYDAGIKSALRDNAMALKMAHAILDVMDERYEFKEEDY